MNNKTLFAIAFIINSLVVFAQPSNDDKGNAITITSKYNCSVGYRDYYNFELLKAKVENGQKDVWFKFISTSHHYNLAYNYTSAVSYEIVSTDQSATVIYDKNNFEVSKIDAEYYIRFYAIEAQRMSLDQPFCFIAYPGNWSKEDAVEITENTSNAPKSNAFDGASQSGVDFTCNDEQLGYNDIWFKFNAKSTLYDVTTRISSSMYYFIEILDEQGLSVYCDKGGREEIIPIETEVNKTYYIHAGQRYTSADRTFGVGITPKGTVGYTKNQQCTLIISPNPIVDVVYITNANNDAYYIMDNQGTTVAKGFVCNNQIAVDNLPQGVYTLSIGLKSVQFIKTK